VGKKKLFFMVGSRLPDSLPMHNRKGFHVNEKPLYLVYLT